jgi:hypothetical protein
MAKLCYLVLLAFATAASCGEPEGEESVLGCGGFIQSARPIDFSRINIRLLTKQGALKDETDCAPNNGYYFVPVYEKGEYRLQVVPPLGWQFNPPEVIVNIDGSTDDCSRQRDINFVFAGFGVVGQVVVQGRVVDPDSVTLWIRIRIGNPDPGSRGKKVKKFQWKNALFSYFKIFFTT